eukprot:jgi/Galph1/4819/GphlegSOOS_G3442.1
MKCSPRSFGFHKSFSLLKQQPLCTVKPRISCPLFRNCSTFPKFNFKPIHLGNLFGGRQLSFRPKRSPTHLLYHIRAIQEGTYSTCSKQILDELRQDMRSRGIHAFIVSGTDPHLSEYPPEHFNRRKFVSGFTGSSGTVLVTEDKALLWTDGRYFIQAAQELDDNWELMKGGVPGVPSLEDWLVQNLSANSVVGLDPFVHSYHFVDNMRTLLLKMDISLVFLTKNPIDNILRTKQPPLPKSPIHIHPIKYAGQSTSEKLGLIRSEMSDKDADVLLVPLLDEIAWLLNLRGSDIPHCPVFLAYLLIGKNSCSLYVDEDKIDNSVGDYLNKYNIHIRAYEQVLEDVQKLSSKDARIWLDPYSTCAALGAECVRNGIFQTIPIPLMKAVKNEAEIQGMKEAHIRDGVSLVYFLSWLETEAISNEVSEYEAAEKLHQFRAEHSQFITESFPTICGSGPNGAIIHYRPLKDSSRVLNTEELILLDSGAQYEDGTTDVTRTFHLGTPTDKERECYTRVLQGHIALDTAVFPKGTAGFLLDSYARRKLWECGLDYRHGTGHGVGAALNVHEGPQSISPRVGNGVSLLPGMIVSNEPGYYEDDHFGVRLENLLLTVEKQTRYRFGDIPFFGFEALTLIPFQQKMIKTEMLQSFEIEWINQYHSRVWHELNTRVKVQNMKEWLFKNTQPISFSPSAISSQSKESTFSTTRRSFLSWMFVLFLSSVISPMQLKADTSLKKESVEEKKDENLMNVREEQPSFTAKCFLDLQVEGYGTRRVVIGLYGGIAPKTTELFRQLCSNKDTFSYQGSEVYRVIEGSSVQMGRVFRSDEVTDSLRNDDFLNECCKLKHNVEGLVSMVRAKPSNLHDYRFFIRTLLQTLEFPHVPSSINVNPKSLQLSLHRKIFRFSNSRYEKTADELNREEVYRQEAGLTSTWEACGGEVSNSDSCPSAGSLEGVSVFFLNVPMDKYEILYGPEVISDSPEIGLPLVRDEQGEGWSVSVDADLQGNSEFYVDYNCSSSGTLFYSHTYFSLWITSSKGTMMVSMYILLSDLVEERPPLPMEDKNLSSILEAAATILQSPYLLKLQWQKECLTGISRPGIEFGYIKEFVPSELSSQQEILEQKVALYPSLSSESSAGIGVVGVTDPSTDLYVSCQNGSQLFRPEVIADCMVETEKCVSIRGLSTTQQVSGKLLMEEGETDRFAIFYSCEKARREGIINTRLVLNFPPYEPLTFQWKKDCGGMQTTSISVGTSWHGRHVADIISEGKTAEPFSFITSYLIDEDKRDFEFFVSTTSEDVTSLEKVVITVEKPRIVATRVSPSGQLPLSATKTAPVQLHFICLNDGESQVVITLPFLYRSLEFSVLKKCRKPQLRRAQGFTVYHATGIVVLAALAVSIASGYLFLRRKRKSSPGFSNTKGLRSFLAGHEYRPVSPNLDIQ